MVWDGHYDAGRAVSSGVYFYEVKAAGEERIGKLHVGEVSAGAADVAGASGRRCPGAQGTYNSLWHCTLFG